MEVVDQALLPLSETMGFPVDQLKFMFAIIFSYPLALGYRFIKDPTTRHLYTIGVGASMIYICMGLIGIFHLLVSTGLVYAIMHVLPSNSKNMPYLSFVVALGYLSALNIYRLVFLYMQWTVDITCVIMISTVKISTVAWNYYDGKMLEKNPEQPGIPQECKENSITKLPSPLEYFSYVFYFPTMLTGPAFHIKPYIAFINNKLYKHEKYNPTGEMPNNVYATLESFGISMGCFAVFIYLVKNYPETTLYDPHGFDNFSWLQSTLFTFFCILSTKSRYYFIWKLAEGAGILTGLGFNKYDSNGNIEWTRLCNVNILTLETAGSVREVSTYWNRSVGDWLKNYFYLRTAGKSGKPPGWALYVTNLLSAFWHGFYPGYYISFFYYAWVIDIYRRLRNIFRPMMVNISFVEKNGKQVEVEDKTTVGYYAYIIIGRILTSFVWAYGTIGFVVWSVERTVTYYNNILWMGHILTGSVFLMTLVLPSVLPKQKKKPQ
eukprot:TRINITY_DN8047_c0_g1_i1.p1 TRINITY_DN8047_c0_g1~~TRINITY_DN8047_c0_g1_i1.p1  ORF type:complete len:491 (-),score=112.46 TRINITY_DN8047_c0_g1_i1:16-1488(-)